MSDIPDRNRERAALDLLLQACRDALPLLRDDDSRLWLQMQIEKALVICPKTESKR